MLYVCFQESLCHIVSTLVYSFQTFIVRKSSQPNTMALSIQFPDKDGQPNVDHYLIESFGNKYHLQGSARMFEDVPNLIAFYCENRYVVVDFISFIK